MISLAMRKGDRRLTSRFIGWWTGSIYSHCELVIGDFCYSSSMIDKGVRKKKINLNPRKWDVMPLPWADEGGALPYFERSKGFGYGWLSLLSGQMFNMNRKRGKGQFCSQWCANALGLPNASSYSPESLLRLCTYLNGRGCSDAETKK